MFKIKVDARELLVYSRKLRAAERVTNRAIAVSLNNVGDGVVASLARTLSRQSGLSLEQIRGLMSVQRATRNNLAYEIRMPEQMTSEQTARRLEGRRESGDFGARQPGQVVIVVTKKDELVCMECKELGAAGPMPIEVAMEHVPKHPNCRCVILPYVTRKRLPVTMTTVSGTSSGRRSGDVAHSVDQSSTLRQLAQEALDRTSRSIRIELR